MPLLHDNKEPISANDLETLQEMMKGSLQSIIARLELRRDSIEENRTAHMSYDPLIEVYRKGLKDLPERFKEAQSGRKNVTVFEFMNKVYDDLANETLEALNTQSRLDPNEDNFGDACNALYVEIGGSVYGKALFPEIGQEKRDDPEVFRDQVGTFSFSDEPMEGVKDIKDFMPVSGNIQGLYEGRAGNSATLSEKWIRKIQEQYKQAVERKNPLGIEKNKADLEKIKTAPFGLRAGAEYVRLRASEMMAKDKITFSDVFETYSNINRMLRPGHPDAGMLRGCNITAGNIVGPSSGVIPYQTYSTLKFIADGMNKIKQTQDPALQKTRAIELSAFAYQMLLAEHIFTDGNGRSSRMFADSILQSFGLPPHTPSKAESDIMKTLGEDGGMNFKDGAKVFLDNVKKSDLELKKDPLALSAKQKRTAPAPEKKPGGIQEEYSTKLSAIYEVNDDTVRFLHTLKTRAENAKGRFRDSKEYKDFLKAAEKSLTLAEKINQNKGMIGFDEKKADAEYASSIRKLLKTAADYKEYKLDKKTADQGAEPEKKALNSDDRRKLEVIDSVTDNKELIKVKKAPAHEAPIL